ncbi:hypothetical protein KSP39_PZI021732 [Platanthera zijinensis]|uniref:25S rRNA (uridine-N(3))-methyltransferase BMT5-like domain-containing protein n=1 Tax=Platanthera zijinensis TaxID=2320716 RepID=A0AAP0FWF3_9ASPA
MELVLSFFENANCMLRSSSEVHVSHRTFSPFSSWKLEELASRCSLIMIRSTDFSKYDYVGYKNKSGGG